MNIRQTILFPLFAAGAAAGVLANELPSGNGNPAYGPSTVQAQLRLNVDPGTGVVHFIRDTGDPKIVTRTYLLKHADPYELRPYLREAVQTRRVEYPENSKFYNTAGTGITCIRMNDGTGLLLVSAEEYRFRKQPGGMGIDEIVARLDRPKLVNSSGQPKYLYFPRNRPAAELQAMLKNVGADIADDPVELIGGKDKIEYDSGLNCLFFNTALYSRKNIEYLARRYDVPHGEVRLKVTVYELYAENDAKLGLDFQAWKNNDGLELLSTGARLRDNWAATAAGGLSAGADSSRTQFFNFNPKWNTRYIDFLTSIGKAGVLHSAAVSIQNNSTAVLERTTQVFCAAQEPAASGVLQESYLSAAGRFDGTEYTLEATGLDGQPVTLDPAAVATGKLTVNALRVRLSGSGETRILLDSTAGFRSGGRDLGRRAEAAALTISRNGTALAWSEGTPPLSFPIERGNLSTLKPSTRFGFEMTVTPSINADATILDVKLSNSSLIGYQSNGEPRIQQDGTIHIPRLMIGNHGNRFVIGGLEKRQLVRSSGGIPLLKDLPGIGWLFSTESESTKRSRLVVAAECESVRPDTGVPDGLQEDIFKLSDDLKHAGVRNTFGYGQYLIDR